MMQNMVKLAIAAAVGILGLQLLVASPASAAGSFTDNGNGTVTLTYSAVNANYGWIVCTGSTPLNSCNMTNLAGRLGFTQSTGMVQPGASPVTIQLGTNYYSWGMSSVTSLSAGSYTFAYWDNNDMSTSVASIANVSIGSAPPSNDSSLSATGSAPAPVVQEFGKPAEATCDAAAPEGLNWAGVPSGGWGVTWAQWLNEGKGGAVCSRTLAYSGSLNAWTIR